MRSQSGHGTGASSHLMIAREARKAGGRAGSTFDSSMLAGVNVSMATSVETCLLCCQLVCWPGLVTSGQLAVWQSTLHCHLCVVPHCCQLVSPSANPDCAHWLQMSMIRLPERQVAPLHWTVCTNEDHSTPTLPVALAHLICILHLVPRRDRGQLLLP